MNSVSGKCLDAKDDLVVIEADCNPLAMKRWKLLNDGQICDTDSATCMSFKVETSKWGGLVVDYLLYMVPMLRAECGTRNCKSCWVRFQSVEDSTKSKTKNQIKIEYNGYDLCP